MESNTAENLVHNEEHL